MVGWYEIRYQVIFLSKTFISISIVWHHFGPLEACIKHVGSIREVDKSAMRQAGVTRWPAKFWCSGVIICSGDHMVGLGRRRTGENENENEEMEDSLASTSGGGGGGSGERVWERGGDEGRKE